MNKVKAKREAELAAPSGTTLSPEECAEYQKLKTMSPDLEATVSLHYDLLDALKAWPAMPSPSVLNTLSYAAKFPEDWETGKRLQREQGLSVVPPTTECECGAGFWWRITHTV